MTHSHRSNQRSEFDRRFEIFGSHNPTPPEFNRAAAKAQADNNTRNLAFIADECLMRTADTRDTDKRNWLSRSLQYAKQAAELGEKASPAEVSGFLSLIKIAMAGWESDISNNPQLLKTTREAQQHIINGANDPSLNEKKDVKELFEFANLQIALAAATRIDLSKLKHLNSDNSPQTKDNPNLFSNSLFDKLRLVGEQNDPAHATEILWDIDYIRQKNRLSPELKEQLNQIEDYVAAPKSDYYPENTDAKNLKMIHAAANMDSYMKNSSDELFDLVQDMKASPKTFFTPENIEKLSVQLHNIQREIIDNPECEDEKLQFMAKELNKHIREDFIKHGKGLDLMRAENNLHDKIMERMYNTR
jgi:hypothetical protein